MPADMIPTMESDLMAGFLDSVQSLRQAYLPEVHGTVRLRVQRLLPSAGHGEADVNPGLQKPEKRRRRTGECQDQAHHARSDSARGRIARAVDLVHVVRARAESRLFAAYPEI